MDVPDDPANPKILNLKMLKGATITTHLPIWDLMMKNVYSLGAYNVQEDKFYLNVVYADDLTGADYTYLPVQGEPNIGTNVLIRTLNLDNVNVQGEPTPDGVFDFLENKTILPKNGRIIFPVREPFGSHLERLLTKQENKDKYVYQELYDSTKWLAQQVVLKNKFFLRGSFQSSSNNEISLNAFNVPQGSVKVTANGTPLTEGSDYMVDYTLGKVTILNTQLLNSGAVIDVTSENNSLFNIQQKTVVGARVDYKVNKDLILGGTVMHLWERPLTPKVNIGDEPLLNTIVGLDGSYKTESRWLTKMVDYLPFIETKEISSLTISGEYAQLFPHQPKTIGDRGTSFIDDFEGSETPFDMRLGNNWFLASTPEGQPDLFPEGSTLGIEAGKRRAKLAWYTIDPIFQREQTGTQPPTPTHLQGNTASFSNHYTRIIQVNEVFPNKQLQNMAPQNLPTLDLAYYPSERGPYNYSVENVNPDGTFANPENNWAGIQRRIETNDFEAANIDYIEMWFMSPWMYNQNAKGTLYLNLGQVSEDVLKDRAKSFENGLPTDLTIPNQTRTTPVAIVPTGRTLNNAFVNEQDARQLQDVGLDGMNDATEQQFFDSAFLQPMKAILSPEAYQTLFEDPSGDNYRFHSSAQFDADQTPVLNRYKDYNGQEGNSPLASFQPDGYPIGKTNTPDDEDINQDFSLNTIEEYYQYKIEIDPAKLVIGQNFVADIQESAVKLDDGTEPKVYWYLLRIPITAYDKKVGNIQDFKSIRFMRMYLKDFDQPVVLRFAQFQLVRAEWRRYLKSLSQPIDGVPTTPVDETKFSTGTVNIEENGFRNPVNYVLPPGFNRVIDPTTPNSVQQNEQSLSLRVCDLNDGDGRGVFKTTRLDIRNYKRIQAFVNEDEAVPVPSLKDGELQAFIRFGTDLENNYYEYSIPLQVTQPKSNNPEQVWPSANEISVELEELYAAKQERYTANFALTQEFITTLPNGAVIRLKGLPDVSNVRVIMLGVRNPLKDGNPDDDGQAKCAEIWFNELRMNEFVNQGGWAANGRMVIKLADLGNITASMNYQTIGFGGLDKKLNDRNLHETFMYDVSGSFELGKFFPAKSGISVPMYVGRSVQRITPKFNPLNPDILMETAINTAREEDRETIRDNAIDLTVRRSINFTNVKKNKLGAGKAHLWDIENFNLSYSYTEVDQKNQQTKENLQKTYRTSLGYNFSFPTPKALQPFKKLGKSPWLAIIRDFKLTPYPRTIGFRADVDRFYARNINRNNDDPNTIVPELYNKNFTMNRFYNMTWDITGQLKLDYNATNRARIDEPEGKVSRQENPDSFEVVLNNLKNLGRNTNFNQTVNLNYSVPLNKIPILNWITLNGNYTTNYEWKTAPPATTFLGNEIQNSQVYSVNGQFNMVTLYNKVPYLRDVNRGRRSKPKKNSDSTPPDDPKKKKDDDQLKGAGPFMARLLMSVKSANFNYSVTNGMYLPGFMGSTEYLGNDFNLDAPGLPFVFGSQDGNIRYRLADMGLISRDMSLFNQFSQKSSTTLSTKATLEPIRDLRIDLAANRNTINALTSTFKVDSSEQFTDLGLQESGSYVVSIITIRTAFDKVNKQGKSETFTRFENYRYTLSQRIALEQGADPTVLDPDGYIKGYGKKSQDVLIGAFLSAYTGTKPGEQKLNPFPRIPLPGWNVTYSGLNRNKELAKIFTNITLRHSYNSSYTAQNFTTPLSTGDTNSAGNVLPRYAIRTISISEQLNPLISVDVSLKNGITGRFEFKKTRTIALELSSYRVTENRTTEVVMGLGYKTKGLRLPFKINRKRPYLPNDLNFRLDFSIRDSKNAVSEIDNVTTIPAQGNKIISINPTIDYSITDKLNLRIFYDRRATQPVVATSFPTAITRGGITLRYTIQ
ncbi:MAG: cell surface protein SprA [Bacteroidota bacterium]|nr:cell surface protein SprA [Bacteroidota bacterium]MDX5429922.1 cell surface protein SprA [Bacteroidota bacterium]MDX5468696.1 cell surface protein SprA [Bacteroidota bacterium]